ncbi:hypothetical protein J3B02_002781 [Coemansia erecta]|uniref:Uncharacterized protein n=1 Tax=Coemansia asiatica TaxID=1052880 RepID=A0A9W7XIU7_9FUNG|nr:hypothetical protein LPJ64_004591 [Coemansia asiatica]KAJ2854220.1 hypothetical protein J3B02_002781 [Coemansia erecta]
MQQPEDPTAHEIIVLSPDYHLSIHYPQGSLYVDVWLGINSGADDLLVHLSEMRRQALNTSPPSETQSEVSDSTGAGRRKDSGCSPPPLNVATRRSNHGLFNCPGDKRPVEWMVAKESLVEARSLCQTHYTKFARAVDRIRKYNRQRIPNIDPLAGVLDELAARNTDDSGALDRPKCCICSASPYTRLFFSML